ncbi:dihydrolipoamide acetyltransferase family protein [Clostridium aminobutyricum]|uniref:Dihydrolipoamide acetyltransferase component of pyruvate dehydrogenase complex n=1 Tax=Clostridium aminobutyricum TaxID=33953 RepID=A0A939D8L0_CLOAM|nr:dihydrolipoamide acetyltransferase family protein [Clostridium aminobutyricum]MBN7773115.1 2-oxo acid dehydrogenase subunit E2 [Clostridium aminobutyricum]
MAEIIIMPKLGFNMNEGKLVKWYKKEGDAVAKGENLFSIETDKTNMDIEATGDGVVRKLFIEEGDTLPVTLPIAIVGNAEENINAVMADALAQLGKEVLADPDTTSHPVAESTPVSATPAVSAKTEGGKIKITPRARRVAAENGLSIDSLPLVGTGFDGGICEKDILGYLASNKIRVSPVAKAMADAEGISLDDIKGSGIGGKIMKADMEAVMNNRVKAEAAGTAAEVTAGAGEKKFSPDGKEILEEVPYAGIRKIIGEKLAESKFTAPHLYFTQKVNLDKLLELRKEVNAAQEQKVSVTDFITKAAVKALQKYPDMNSSLIGGTIVKYKTVNIGIAVAAPTGLIVPNVKSAEQMSVVELAAASAPLFKKAREGKLTPGEYTGGTFTISNLGMFGIENFTAIINPPEVGILAVSSTKDEPFVVAHKDGSKTIEIKPMMNIQLTVDHRLIDGLLAAQFVTEIKKYVENPISLFV